MTIPAGRDFKMNFKTRPEKHRFYMVKTSALRKDITSP
jgi:hypothetical protein